MKHTLFLIILLFPLLLPAQRLLDPSEIRPELTRRFWPAQWITHPMASATDWGVFHFRNTFNLAAAPARLVVHASGDNRYRLYVNGTPVVDGPARDELDYWRFESLDIAPYLKAGENTVAAIVWNFGRYRPVFQQSHATAFLLQADEPAFAALDTGGEGWRVLNDTAYAPEMEGIRALNTYHVTGPGERLDAARYPWGWEQAGYDDAEWDRPRNVERAHPATAGSGHVWGLTPRSLPLMEERPVRLATVRRAEGITVPEAFLQGNSPLTIPANSSATLLFDQGHLTNAYPLLSFSGGRGGRLTLTYAESLYLPDGGNDDKGHRDEVEGKVMRGQQDVVLPDGGRDRLYRPLWFRTYRYLQLEVQTGAEPLTVHDLYGQFTGFPFEERGRFASDDPGLSDIWTVGWRTARLCAGETYYDCPYYEQLQYVGDTRIQALISLYAAGDDRLMRQAIDAYDHSREANGLTHSRFPEARPVQFIPPYSLFWISMVHDYWMHRDHSDYVAGKMMGVQTVLDWFRRQVHPEVGLIYEPDYWNFVDWSWPWSAEQGIGGIPPIDGGSSILTLHYIYTLDQAAELALATGHGVLAERYAEEATGLRRMVMEKCWDESRGLLADTPARTSFSQHANIFGILAEAIPEAQRADVMTDVLNDPALTQATFYFQFYLFEALDKLGWGDRYIELLAPWRAMLDLGLTTFAENPDPTRSDCHAWSASPNYHLLSLVAGVRPAEPGFRSVLIEPTFGPLRRIEATVPHPEGLIGLQMERQGETGLRGTVTLPVNLRGKLVWKGREIELEGGRQEVNY